MGGGGLFSLLYHTGFDDLCLIMTIALSGQCDNKESSTTAGGCSFEGFVDGWPSLSTPAGLS